MDEAYRRAAEHSHPYDSTIVFRSRKREGQYRYKCNERDVSAEREIRPASWTRRLPNTSAWFQHRPIARIYHILLGKQLRFTSSMFLATDYE